MLTTRTHETRMLTIAEINRICDYEDSNLIDSAFHARSLNERFPLRDGCSWIVYYLQTGGSAKLLVKIHEQAPLDAPFEEMLTGLIHASGECELVETIDPAAVTWEAGVYGDYLR